MDLNSAGTALNVVCKVGRAGQGRMTSNATPWSSQITSPLCVKREERLAELYDKPDDGPGFGY